MPSEKAIEKKVVAWATAQGFYTRKFSSPAHRGVPDRIFIRKGCVVFLEFKRPGKEPTELQARELMLLKDQKIEAAWCDSFIQGVGFLADAALRYAASKCN